MQRVEEIRLSIEAERDADRAELERMRTLSVSSAANESSLVADSARLSEQAVAVYRRELDEERAKSAAAMERVHAELAQSVERMHIADRASTELRESLTQNGAAIAYVLIYQLRSACAIQS